MPTLNAKTSSVAFRANAWPDSQAMESLALTLTNALMEATIAHPTPTASTTTAVSHVSASLASLVTVFHVPTMTSVLRVLTIATSMLPVPTLMVAFRALVTRDTLAMERLVRMWTNAN